MRRLFLQNTSNSKVSLWFRRAPLRDFALCEHFENCTQHLRKFRWMMKTGNVHVRKSVAKLNSSWSRKWKTDGGVSFNFRSTTFLWVLKAYWPFQGQFVVSQTQKEAFYLSELNLNIKTKGSWMESMTRKKI